MSFQSKSLFSIRKPFKNIARLLKGSCVGVHAMTVINENYILRRAERKDVSRISELWGKMLLFHANYEPEYYNVDKVSIIYYRDTLLRSVDFSHSLVLVVEEKTNSSIVGFLYGNLRRLPPVFIPEAQAYISDIYV